MVAGKRFALTAVLFLLTLGTIRAQTDKPDTRAQEQKVRDMVSFLQYVLNTLGSSKTDARDKDVLITASYSKIFRDSAVQVEDDLAAARSTITNKDVQAYLKDVDFFFQDVKFEFTIEGIKSQVNANGQLFYLVSLTRNMTGKTSEGVAVNNTIPRFIEVNYDPKQQDLKIVSIYTHEFDESELLTNWWHGLSYEWQNIFRKRLNLTDSATRGDIRDMVALVTLDLSNNRYIQTLGPLTQLTALRVLDISNTEVTDLDPIRNLNDLTELNLAGTAVSDMMPLRYAGRMKRLDLSRTQVRSIAIVERMPELEFLDISATNVLDFTPLAACTQLKQLELSNCKIIDLSPISSLVAMEKLNISVDPVTDLSPLSGMTRLTTLNIDSTYFRDAGPIGKLVNLEVVSMNRTSVKTLDPLVTLRRLERIYCDHTPINRALADAFMAKRPDVLVVFDSEDLMIWWGTVSPAWQEVFSAAARIGAAPTKEGLARVTHLDSVNVAGRKDILDLEPLRKLTGLKSVIAGGTSIADVSPLGDHREMRKLDISGTAVGDINVLRTCPGLEVLHADSTRIQDLAPLGTLKNLKVVYADGTGINDLRMREFHVRKPDCLVVYESAVLTRWWNGLSEEWKEIFRTQVPVNDRPTREELHRLVETEAVEFHDISVSDLSPLKVFILLKKLRFSGTAVSDLSPLSGFRTLKSLRASGSPIRDLWPLTELTQLEDLDISETAVEDLDPLVYLQDLKRFTCSGTPIKKLNALEEIQDLEYVDCSNTDVKKLKPLFALPLRTLKCFNTRISGKEVEEFKRYHPDSEVVYYR